MTFPAVQWPHVDEHTAAARAHCARALALLAACRGDPAAEVARALARAPRLPLAHCIRAGLAIAAGDDAPVSALAESVDAARSVVGEASAHERAHVAAARAWLARDHEGALERWHALCDRDPRDLLALLLAHAGNLALGRSIPLRDLPRRALAAWDRNDPGYADLLGLHAFGLEETGDLNGAVIAVREALALDPRNARAIHAMAHVLETQGRHAEGLAWLAAHPLPADTMAGYRAHLEWHRALFELGRGNADGALRVFDRHLAANEPRVSVLADASNLLWRLRLSGVHAGRRWRRLARSWERVATRIRRPFNLLHAMAAFVGSARSWSSRRVVAGMRTRARTQRDDAATGVALAAGHAFAAFARRDYPDAAARLLRLPREADPIGGSRVQRDLLRMTLRAAIRRLKGTAARS